MNVMSFEPPATEDSTHVTLSSASFFPFVLPFVVVFSFFCFCLPSFSSYHLKKKNIWLGKCYLSKSL